MHETPAAVDWADWARRWDAQQELNIPRREERFRVMLELVAEAVGPEPVLLLDLACGTGSISSRVLERFGATRIVALDADPLLLAIGQGALGDGGRRLRWARADLRGADWPEALRDAGSFDGVLSSTALHWLTAGELVRVYRALGTLIRPGGIFLNAEHLLLAPPGGRFAALAGAARRRLTEGDRARNDRHARESYDEWWDRAKTEPHFADLLADREKVFHDHPHHHEDVTARFHEEALAMAGFSETAVVWRYLDDTIVGAIR